MICAGDSVGAGYRPCIMPRPENCYTTPENCLSEAVSLTKNFDIDKYKYSGHGIEFDRKEKFSVGNGSGSNCIIFGVDISSSMHVDNKKNIF